MHISKTAVLVSILARSPMVFQLRSVFYQ